MPSTSVFMPSGHALDPILGHCPFPLTTEAHRDRHATLGPAAGRATRRLPTVGVNLAVLVFCVAVGVLAVRWGTARARSPADRRRLATLLGVVAAFLLVNAAAAWVGLQSVRAALQSPAVTTAAAVAGARAGEPVVVAGRLGPGAESDDPRYPAYFLCRGASCDYHGPHPLPIELADGEVGVVNSDYARRSWPVWAMTDDESFVHLERESPLVVVGTTAPGSSSPPGIEALVVHAGTYETFRARAARSRAVATTLLGLDLFGALAAGIMAVRASLPRERPKGGNHRD